MRKEIEVLRGQRSDAGGQEANQQKEEQEQEELRRQLQHEAEE